MEHLSGKDLYRTLQILDIETGFLTSESLDWLFDNKETAAILSWLCTYVNENNIKTYKESVEYANIQREENEISPEYINNVFNSDPTFSHILEVNVGEVNLLKKNIDNEKIKEYHLDKLTSKYLNLEASTNSQIAKLEEKNINAEVKYNNYSSECKNKAKVLDNLHKDVESSVEKVHNILSNTNKTGGKNLFFCKIPLDTYIFHSDSLITNLNLWIRKNMGMNDVNNTNIDMCYIESELSRMKYAIEESIVNLVKSECAEKELHGRLNYLRQNSHTPISFEDDRVQEIQITSRINTLHEDLNRLYNTDLQRNAENETNNLINTFLLKNAEIKLSTYKDTLKLLNSIYNEVNHALSQFILIFLLLKCDKNYLQVIEKFLEDVYFYSSKYLKHYGLRTELMNEIENNVSKLKPILLNNFTFETENHSNESLIEEFKKQEISIENLENKLFAVGNIKYLHVLKNYEENIKKARKIIWCGPTMQAVIVPYEYLRCLSVTNYQLEKVCKLIETCMHIQISAMNQLDKNRWFQFRRLIWMFFLQNPSKLIEIIENIKTYVTEQAKISS